MTGGAVILAKIALVIESFSCEGSGGFYWWLDTPENRDLAVAEGKRDVVDYGRVIVLACVLKVPDDSMPSDITDLLDSELVFESGNVGEILFKSFNEEEVAA